MARRHEPDPDVATADPAAVREAALKLLERTRRTRSDLARRLRDKGFAPPAVDDVLDRLAEVGLVDDAEFARAWLTGRWGRRASGWRSLEQSLRQKGVGAEDIARGRALLESREGAADEIALARRAIAQSERRFAALDPHVRRQRQYALLARRGFDGDVIRRALAVPDDEASE